MARNGSGTYAKINTFVAGATITASGQNQNWDDIASEMTNSVAADGQTSMTGALKLANGTAAAPSLTFASDTDTGIYRSSANSVGIALSGAVAVDFSTAGSVFYVPVTFSATATFAAVGTANFVATASFGGPVFLSATAAFSGEIIASATATFAGVLIASATAVFTTVPTAVGSPIVKQSDAASQTEMEAASSTTKYISPGRAQYHPGVAKAWACVTVSGGVQTLAASYGISSVSFGSSGFGFTLSTAMSSTSYAIICSAQGAGAITSRVTARGTSTFSVTTFSTTTGSAFDPDALFVAVFGDQ